jgi:hypothetical protein
MSRMTRGAQKGLRLALAVALAACGGSSDLGLFGSGIGGAAGTSSGGAGSGGAAGAGYGGASTVDASGGGAGGWGGRAGEGGGSGSSDAASVDATVDRVSLDGASPDVAPGRDATVDVRPTMDVVEPRDAGRDAARDANVVVDACVPSVERCDGRDNDCNGRIDEGAACPSGCVGATHGGRAYMLCYAPMAREAWSAAEAACVGAGMHLVRVDDAAENAFIRATADNVNFDGDIWLGGSDAMTERRWVWIDGTPFWTGGPGGMPVANRYTNWASGEPNDGTPNVDCAAMQAGAGTWRDVRCVMRHAFMCEG